MFGGAAPESGAEIGFANGAQLHTELMVLCAFMVYVTGS